MYCAPILQKASTLRPNHNLQIRMAVLSVTLRRQQRESFTSTNPLLCRQMHGTRPDVLKPRWCPMQKYLEMWFSEIKSTLVNLRMGRFSWEAKLHFLIEKQHHVLHRPRKKVAGPGQSWPCWGTSAVSHVPEALRTQATRRGGLWFSHVEGILIYELSREPGWAVCRKTLTYLLSKKNRSPRNGAQWALYVKKVYNCMKIP